MAAPDRWLVLSARLDEMDPLRELLGEGLLSLGGLSVLDEGERLTTYLLPPSSDTEADSFVKDATSHLREWLGGVSPDVTWRWQPNEDWELTCRRGLQPRKVSPRFVVKPSWTEWDAQPGEIIIEIDPEMAFGTGEHSTTRGCLRLLDAHLQAGDRVLDVGSGSGILSIGAARLGATEVVAVEYDPDANLNARDNLLRNGVSHLVTLHERLADPQLLATLDKFDLIVANILSGVIRPLLPPFVASLEAKGRLVLSGILQVESADVVRDAEAAGLELLKEDRDEDWWSAIFVRL